MDQLKTGKFIAELRREKGLTQEQLGEELGVTNKTVSRWENGNYMPDIEMLLLLASAFHVTVNELLAGQRLNAESFPAAAEENLAECLRQSSFTRGENFSFWKKKWRREHVFEFVVFGILSLAVCVLLFCMIPQSKALIPAFLSLVGLMGYCFFNNRMMIYVERKVFDGTTQYAEGSESAAEGQSKSSKNADSGQIVGRIGLIVLCIGLLLNGFELLSRTAFWFFILLFLLFQIAALILHSRNSEG